MYKKEYHTMVKNNHLCTNEAQQEKKRQKPQLLASPQD